MASPMIMCMVAAHAHAPPEVEEHSFAGLVFMIHLAGITSCIYFVIPTASRHIEAAGLLGVPLLFYFKWPSIAYALDILAWDRLFARSFLFAVPMFKVGWR